MFEQEEYAQEDEQRGPTDDEPRHRLELEKHDEEAVTPLMHAQEKQEVDPDRLRGGAEGADEEKQQQDRRWPEGFAVERPPEEKGKEGGAEPTSAEVQWAGEPGKAQEPQKWPIRDMPDPAGRSGARAQALAGEKEWKFELLIYPLPPPDAMRSEENTAEEPLEGLAKELASPGAMKGAAGQGNEERMPEHAAHGLPPVSPLALAAGAGALAAAGLLATRLGQGDRTGTGTEPDVVGGVASGIASFYRTFVADQPISAKARSGGPPHASSGTDSRPIVLPTGGAVPHQRSAGVDRPECREERC